MKVWDTFGAFGDTVVELSTLDLIRMMLGKTINVPGKCILISIGKSTKKSLLEAPTREKQLKLEDLL